MATLGFNTYGKTRVRLLQVLRRHAAHELADINLTILFEGELTDSYLTGDNSQVLPTDTMKNTVYILARERPIECIEEFGLRLGRHFLSRLSHITEVNVSVEQAAWNRIDSHAAAFARGSGELRTAKVKISRETATIVCGIRNVQILKTGHSAFVGYLKDEYTTLPETRERLFGTALDADWSLPANLQSDEFNALHCQVRHTLLDCFAAHESLSVQHTLHAMGQAVLARFKAIDNIHLTMPNKHCHLVDLSRFGLDNPNQIFIPTDESSGFIEARLTR